MLRDALRSITSVAPVTRSLHGSVQGARHGDAAPAEMNMTNNPLADGYHMPAEWEMHERCEMKTWCNCHERRKKLERLAAEVAAGLESSYQV